MLDVGPHFTILPSTFTPKHSNKQAKYKTMKIFIISIVIKGKGCVFLIARWTLNVFCPDKQAEFGSLISYASSSLESVMRMLIFVLITE